MILKAGARLGPYEIIAPLGAGGMGEVYKARDTRLERTVAIKILPTELASDPELRARFEREARAIAALDHPYICAVYDVGEAAVSPQLSALGPDTVRYLVMQYLDGETLAARLARTKGPLSIDQALKIGIEIAGALDKAHGAGITHRDLKPANIMLTKGGAKLLDFGLAKLRGPAAPISMSGMTRLATPDTAHGMILGTMRYMAPEQVEGREADARADIWALGVVLYEMVTGTRPFDGESPASIIGAILKDAPPPLSSRQPLAPAALDHVVSRCLEKDLDERWQTAADLMRELRWLATLSPARGDAPRRTRGARAGAIALACLSAAAVLVIVLVVLARASQSASKSLPIVTFTIEAPPNTIFASAPATVPTPQFAVSPDGRWLAFVAEPIGGDAIIWLRPIDGVAATRIAGTEGASYPFWAPDSRAIGFFALGKLKRIDVPSGAPQTLCDAPDPRGGAWGRSNVIVFGISSGALQQISATGGQSKPFARVVGDKSQQGAERFPSFLSDGRHFLFFNLTRLRRDSTVNVGAIDDSSAAVLFPAQQYSPAFIAPDYLLSVNTNGVLNAQHFDSTTLKVSGEPSMIAQDVAGSSVNAGAFSASGTGVLAYLTSAETLTQLAWFSRDGRRLSSVGPPGDQADVQLSPDERRVAVTRIEPKSATTNILIIDVLTGAQSPLTFESEAHYVNAQPIWSPDGKEIVFRSQHELPAPLLRRPASGIGRAEVILQPRESLPEAANTFPSDWSPDGRFLLFHAPFQQTGYDVWVLPLTGDRKPRPFVRTSGSDLLGRFSPDGTYVAYSSDESGRSQVYVQSFPDGDGRWRVSTDGGAEPRWRADGKELFFIAADRRMMAVPVTTAPAFQHGAPMPLFPTRVSNFASPFRTSYAVSHDGQRFLINAPAENAPTPSITVVVNWTELLKK